VESSGTSSRTVEKRKKTEEENRFGILESQVMQCGVKEVVEQIVKCFWYGKEGHKKWECLEGKEKRKEEAVPP